MFVLFVFFCLYDLATFVPDCIKISRRSSTKTLGVYFFEHGVYAFKVILSELKTRKPCCRRESARCRCNFRSIDQNMINKDQWRTDFKLSYVTYLLNL